MSTDEHLVYGLWRDLSLAVLDDQWAQQALTELQQWRQAKTVAEAIALAREATALESPFGDPDEFLGENDLEEQDDFDIREWVANSDSDWPGALGQWTIEFLPEDWEVGDERDTLAGGPYMHIPLENEVLLLDLARTSGVSIRRDDELINALSQT